MSDISPLTFLSQDSLLTQFKIFAKNIQEALPANSDAAKAIADQVQSIESNQDRWPKHVSDKFRNRTTPVYSSEDITRLSQSFSAYTESINQSRTAVRKQLSEDIGRLKRARDDLIRQASISQDKYDADQNLLSNKLALYSPQSKEYQILLAEKTAGFDSFRMSSDRIYEEDQLLKRNISTLQGELAPIFLITSQQNLRHLLIKKDGRNMGWLPHRNTYTQITASECPSKEVILRRISYEPHSATTNLPLSISNILTLAEEYGSSDTQILQMVNIYLSTHKRELLDHLDSKKQSLPHLIESLSYLCNTIEDKQKVLSHLRTFSRDKNESFSEAVNRFDSLFTFFQYLDRPQESETVKTLAYGTIRMVTPYLISSKCNTAFGSWLKQQQKANLPVSTSEIIRIVTHLESFPDLQLSSPRQLPQFLVTTSLNLPPTESEEISANLVSPCNDIHPVTSTTGPSVDHGISRRSITVPPPTNSEPKAPPPNTRPSRPTTPSRPSGSRPISRTPTGNRTPRQQSKSPGPYRASSKPSRPDSRGRSREKGGPHNTSRSSSRAYAAEIETLAHYSLQTKSPNFRRRQSIPSLFKRPLTPKTYAHLRKTYFYKTSNPERFKDVFKEGRCLRCFSSSHKASSCSKYTSPTPNPCRFCSFLYHPTDQCIFYDRNGKSRSSTPNK